MVTPNQQAPAFLNIVVGAPDDDCEICRAARDGKSPGEILALMGAGEIGGDATLITLDLTEKPAPKPKPKKTPRRIPRRETCAYCGLEADILPDGQCRYCGRGSRR